MRVRFTPSGGEPQTNNDKECNEMQPNATDLKGSPLLATPDEANEATNEATPVQCLRVSGVPNEATLASFPASPLGVNGAKRAKLSHKIEISRESVVPAQA